MKQNFLKLRSGAASAEYAAPTGLEVFFWSGFYKDVASAALVCFQPSTGYVFRLLSSLSTLNFFSPLLRDEGIHGDDRCLGRENLPGENAVNFLIGVETGVLEDDAAVIQVKRAPQRGENDAARRDAEEHQILNATRAKDQVKLVLRKRAHPLLMDHQLSGARDGTVKFGGRRAFYEEIVLLHPLEWGLDIRNFRITFGKSQPHMDDLKWLLPGKFHCLGCIGDDGLRAGDKSKNPHLAIERQQRRFFQIKFLKLHEANLTQRRQDAKQRKFDHGWTRMNTDAVGRGRWPSAKTRRAEK